MLTTTPSPSTLRKLGVVRAVRIARGRRAFRKLSPPLPLEPAHVAVRRQRCVVRRVVVVVGRQRNAQLTLALPRQTLKYIVVFQCTDLAQIVHAELRGERIGVGVVVQMHSNAPQRVVMFHNSSCISKCDKTNEQNRGNTNHCCSQTTDTNSNHTTFYQAKTL
jgi:hypothetical protein